MHVNPTGHPLHPIQEEISYSELMENFRAILSISRNHSMAYDVLVGQAAHHEIIADSLLDDFKNGRQPPELSTFAHSLIYLAINKPRGNPFYNLLSTFITEGVITKALFEQIIQDEDSKGNSGYVTYISNLKTSFFH